MSTSRLDALLGSLLAIAPIIGCVSFCAEMSPAEARTSADPASGAERVDPVARVNGVDIPRSAIDERVNRLMSAFPGQTAPPQVMKRYRRTVLDQLIGRTLVDQAIAAANLPVEPEAVQAEMDAYEAAHGGAAGFEAFLKASSSSKAQMRAGVQRRLALQALLVHRGDLRVTPRAVRAFYDGNAAAFTIAAYVSAREIVLKVAPEAKDADVEAIRQRALRLRAQARAEGADFAELVEAHSEGWVWGRTPPADGVLRFDRTSTIPQVAQAVFETPVGDVAEPVRSRHGWHILKTIGHHDARLQPFEEVRESIRLHLEGAQEAKARDALIKELRAKARIEILIR